MSKKAILFGAVLIGVALALMLEFRPFLETDGAPPPDAMNTPPVVLTVQESVDESPSETRKSEPAIDVEEEGLFSSVEWRDSESPSQGDYPRTYGELRELAEAGDVEATRRLAVRLQTCRNAVLPITEEEISAVASEMRATYSLPLLRDGRFEFLPEATGGLGHRMSAAELESFIDRWQSSTSSAAKLCNDFTMAQREEADYWRDVFESQGGVSKSWREATRNMDHDATIAHVDNMWAMGDPTALEAYADFYGDYRTQLVDPSAQVKSYAYIYAFYEALIETAKYNSDADRLARFQDGLQHVHRYYSDILSEHELQEAHEFARQSVERNENCCLRLPPNSY
jgi:hypothetical protein